MVTLVDGLQTGEKTWENAVARSRAGSIHAALHLEGANYAFADGHVKFYRAINPNAVPPAYPAPAMNGLDYDSDGILGNDATATPSTAGKYD